MSFHETKNFTCGEGDALVINDASLIERAEILREKGTNRSRFLRGLVDKYTWVDVGSSYLPSELLAAFLLAQLEAREHVQTQRRRIWDHYAAYPRDWAAKREVRLPSIPAGCEQAYHQFHRLRAAGRPIAATDFAIDDGGADGVFGAPVGGVYLGRPQEGEHSGVLAVEMGGEALGGRQGGRSVEEAPAPTRQPVSSGLTTGLPRIC